MKYKSLFMLLLLICSCTSSFENEVIKKISQNFETSDSIISIDEIYDDWDNVYVFLECAGHEDIIRVIGKTDYLHDASQDIVFEKGGIIVRYEQLYPYDGWPNKSSLSIRFWFNDSCYMKFNKREAIFKVIKRNNYYILSPYK